MMKGWKNNPNKRSLVIVRRSSKGQEENTSERTQSREIQDYAVKHGLEVVLNESIIETAYKQDKRKKYTNLIERALKEDIFHILFFVSSREARNLTDIEYNGNLARAGKIAIHHVSEGRVYDDLSSNSDYTMREIQAVVNKSESRDNGTRMRAAYKTKALDGWYPYRHTPLGYRHAKDTDEFGNTKKGTERK
jgi:DNA invertase Pin-like site-specific DNA recombinase